MARMMKDRESGGTIMCQKRAKLRRGDELCLYRKLSVILPSFPFFSINLRLRIQEPSHSPYSEQPMAHELEQKGFQVYLEDANPVTGTWHGAWGKGVVTFHLSIGDVGPGHIQKADSSPRWYPAY